MSSLLLVIFQALRLRLLRRGVEGSPNWLARPGSPAARDLTLLPDERPCGCLSASSSEFSMVSFEVLARELEAVLRATCSATLRGAISAGDGSGNVANATMCALQRLRKNMPKCESEEDEALRRRSHLP